ncbi:unnamed protein product [Cylicocyclus nassatus]|uniref:Reverse transcriptase/retrotransposon-derived protein RNase H-like domain-containing protein n=1 Tax=Cylicocyclus nassatus TaxID=53992 RepID=A0AA36GTM0_CYLNA|nr:unnamed protein product [Cylicocyclus nassatus]
MCLKALRCEFTKEEIKFLGFILILSGHVLTIDAPLIALTKNVFFNWTPQCKEAVDHVKQALTTAPILASPRLSKFFIIETDSSAKGVAGVLKQKQGGLERVIAYASRTLNEHEARYPAIELEALGLVYAVQKFRPSIEGAKCTIITDHAPLKALLYRKILLGDWLNIKACCRNLISKLSIAQGRGTQYVTRCLDFTASYK